MAAVPGAPHPGGQPPRPPRPAARGVRGPHRPPGREPRHAAPLPCSRPPTGSTRDAAPPRFLVPPLVAGATARAAYRIPTRRRGRYRVGPLAIAVTDPFGVARRTEPSAGEAELVVRPRVHDIVAPVAVGSRISAEHEASAARAVVSDLGDEFVTLREYELGDDLRRVHWRSTARTGELMIRQDEARWRSRAAVVLDVQPGAHDAASFEVAVEAAASVSARLGAPPSTGRADHQRRRGAGHRRRPAPRRDRRPRHRRPRRARPVGDGVRAAALAPARRPRGRGAGPGGARHPARARDARWDRRGGGAHPTRRVRTPPVGGGGRRVHDALRHRLERDVVPHRARAPSGADA